MGDVVEAVLRLSTFSERQILDLFSDGQLGERFPFHPKAQEMPPAKKANTERERLAAALAWQEQAHRDSEE